MNKRARQAGVISASLVTLLLTGVAGARTPEPQPEARKLEPVRQQHDVALEAEVGDLIEAGSRVRDAQARAEKAGSRAQELETQRQDLREGLRTRQEVTPEIRDRSGGEARGVYKGEDTENASATAGQVPQGEAADARTTAAGQTVGGSEGSRGGARSDTASKRKLEDVVRKLRQRQAAYKRSRQDQRTYVEKARLREAELADYVGALGTKKDEVESRLAQLEEADRAGLFALPPASGYGGGTAMRAEEIEIAERDIVAEPVEPIPYERYVQIYKAAAKRYGFAEDWYVLAAVGKVESDHGQNMGPSPAGAMGPMQFLPSTWSQYGVDGNGDGKANIMDPEDAIPAAASYLLAGGAPEDWYAALYTYNHAGWYVREVLGIAEGYRRLANDDTVEPYV